MKKTKFYKAHQELKGKMVNFVNWELPIHYSSINDEHNAVRTAGGIFDVSHMGELLFKGPQALEAVQYLTSNNAAKLIPGKIQYSALLTDSGCFVDDLLVYMLNENEYMLVVNAANIEKDYQWILKRTSHLQVNISDESEDYSQVAIQGPQAEKLLSEFCQEDLSEILYYHFITGKVLDQQAIISRTGYTGEDGFEFYFKSDSERATKLYLALAEKGEKYHVVPAGLGCRDTLRLEAKMALYGNDIDDSHTVLEADLGWILKLKKGNFIGREALLEQKETGIKRKLVGFEVQERGIARQGYPVYVNQKQYGIVTSGTFAPYLKKAIGLTYLPIDCIEIDTEFQIGIRDNKVSAKVVETPFYKRNP
jgi:aminomethyltransferase